jgi:hypothetical protein
MEARRVNKQKGIALPIALIMFVVMLIGGIYLARSAATASLTVGNMAYQRNLRRTADIGMLRAYDWLGATHAPATKIALEGDVTAQGYVAAFSFADPQLGPGDAAFWNGSRTISDVDGGGTDVEVVIHRLCSLKVAFSAAGNHCVTSSMETTGSGAAQEGTNLDVGSGEPIASLPQIHYLITSRVINARRGATAVNQLVVMMGV